MSEVNKVREAGSGYENKYVARLPGHSYCSMMLEVTKRNDNDKERERIISHNSSYGLILDVRATGEGYFDQL